MAEGREIRGDWWRFLSEVGKNKTAAAFWEFKGAHLREVALSRCRHHFCMDGRSCQILDKGYSEICRGMGFMIE
jgi:hypothetical protein